MKINFSILQYFSFCLLVLMLSACSEEVTVKLPSSENILVVEGRVEFNESLTEQSINLSILGDFYSNKINEPVIDATVWVVEGQSGDTYEFENRNNGLYTNALLVGKVGELYTLHVEWNNEVYEASEQLLPVASIDSIYSLEVATNTFDDGGDKIAIDFSDPKGIANYYFWENYQDGELNVVPDPGAKFNYILPDVYFDGQKIEGYVTNEEMVIELGQPITVKQIGISKTVYDYYYLLFDQAGRTGTLFDTPPAPVRGNIKNLTNPNHYALGYFYASQVDEAMFVLE
ncbi:DUF4249 domain-containing protein [Reichenbachiella versicolor]|uniref:DUF4249 domain-containing protein n=1 Tax=Reichenbachiella versicolor TaxID=1821036 RepID=UPI000D6DD6DF|nr:DUF4249 domain-containing protein [Reichenbachiella versicolor]